MPIRTRGYAHRVDIHAPPAAVWSALLDPTQLARWFGPNPAIKARAGGSFSCVLDPGIEREALIDVFDPPRRLRLVYLTPPHLPPFDGAVVDDFLLEPAGGGTIIRLLGSGIPEGKLWDGYFVKLRNGSERALARLKLLLERPVAPPRPAA